MSSQQQTYRDWSTTKAIALKNGMFPVKPHLVRPGGHGRTVAPSHVKALGQAMKDWPADQVAFVSRISDPPGLELWETADGSHRVAAANAFNWSAVFIAEVGVDVPSHVMAEWALQSDREAGAHRTVNFADKILVYCRYLENEAAKAQKNECPTLQDMVNAGACQKMGEYLADSRRNLQDFHRIARALFYRDELKVQLAEFSSSLTNDECRKLSKRLVSLHWQWPGGREVPTESAMRGHMQKWFQDFPTILEERQTSARESPGELTHRRRAQQGSGSRKRRQSRSFTYAVEPETPRKSLRLSERTLLAKKRQTKPSAGEDSEATVSVDDAEDTTHADIVCEAATEPKTPLKKIISGPIITGPASPSTPRQPAQDIWKLGDDEREKARREFLQYTRHKQAEAHLADARREAQLLGLEIRQVEGDPGFGLFTTRSVAEGTKFPVWGVTQMLRAGVEPRKNDVYLPAFSGALKMTYHLRMSEKSCAMYARWVSEPTAMLVELIRDGDKQEFLTSPGLFAQKISNGQYLMIQVMEPLVAGQEVSVDVAKTYVRVDDVLTAPAETTTQ